jgi:hypothetical protein
MNHHQQEFRKQALRPPSGIQVMTAAGRHKKGSKTDPSDWRTAPDFSGLVEVVAPAYPNPVSYNSSFKIDINVKTFDAVEGLSVYAFQQPGKLGNPIKIIQQTLEPGQHEITISAQQFARSSGTGNYGNIYRIIFLDGRQKIITYGDVQVK